MAARRRGEPRANSTAEKRDRSRGRRMTIERMNTEEISKNENTWGNETHLGEECLIGSGENSERNVDHLQIFAAGGRGDLPRSRPNVVDDGPLEPWDAEMKT